MVSLHRFISCYAAPTHLVKRTRLSDAVNLPPVYNCKFSLMWASCLCFTASLKGLLMLTPRGFILLVRYIDQFSLIIMQGQFYSICLLGGVDICYQDLSSWWSIVSVCEYIGPFTGHPLFHNGLITPCFLFKHYRNPWIPSISFGLGNSLSLPSKYNSGPNMWLPISALLAELCTDACLTLKLH